MTDAKGILQLHDADLLEQELNDAAGRARLRKLGLAIEPHASLATARRHALANADPRWVGLYERAHRRYGRGITAVRDRVCQGCHITLPTSKTPSTPGAITMCELCSRLLYWA